MSLFKELEQIKDFSESLSSKHYEDVPENWYVIITDVVDSTKAIEAGHYKNVNIAGALSIIALSNAMKDMEFPFVFGGDGVTFLIAPEEIELVSDVLVDTKSKVKEFYDLDLRVGIVPVRDIYNAKAKIQMAKFSVSEHYDQAVLYGNGLEMAETLVKNSDKYLRIKKTDLEVLASFEGFTCRWQDVGSSEGETVAIIVKVREDRVKDASSYYKTLNDKIVSMAGDVSRHHPIKAGALKTGNTEYAKKEALASAGTKKFLRVLLNLLRIKLESIASAIVIAFKLEKVWGYYKLKDLKNYNIISSDYRKFDGTLKMVISVPKSLRERITKYLESEYKKNNIYFGYHISDRAILTCILHVDSVREVHLVDAADGGYALAAKQIKAQQKNKNF